ncbi:phosphodiester glycosidase family protein [Cohnella ginsengisoli]|uniref:Phosphodiester glycosidase family protein n=1 Tax=Cohnella ginsengisoli TaxID=425004 RepID=A0A9X4KHH0_9BACL|nr:phosphodiester glycosidase family protein [Cohnella ginsengisoli]MDG0792070.1 phosphodiester glycosidase family protein [Cohnella ginsengisoli]
MKKRWLWLMIAFAAFAVFMTSAPPVAQTVSAVTAPAKGMIYVDAQGRSYITLRSLDGFAGGRIVQGENGRAVTLSLGEDATLDMSPGSTVATLNGVPVTLKAAPFNKGGSLYVPLTAVTSAFGWIVRWERDIEAAQLVAPDGDSLRLPVARGKHPADMKPVEQASVRFKVGGRTYVSQVVTVALLHPEVRLDTVLAGNKIGKVEELGSMAKRAKARVAINGTFFDAYTDSDFKVPYGYIAGGGKLKKNSSGDKRATFLYDADQLAEIVPGLSFMERFNQGTVEGAVQAGPQLVAKGKVALDIAGEGFKDPKILTNGGARSAIGITHDHLLLLLTTGGATIPQLAEIMRQAGAWQAMNLDGGASSGLWTDGKYLTKPGRLLSNALVVRVG